MMPTRRSLLTSFISGIAISSLPHLAWAENKVTPNSDEQKVIDFMKARSIEHFLMLNEKRGQILFISNGDIIASHPALSGRIKGDNHRPDLGTTPAGIHILRPYHDGQTIGFKQVDGTNLDYAIHTIIHPRGQKRAERLVSNRPEWQRISSGCVNVSQQTLDVITAFTRLTQVYRDEQNTPVVAGSFFVVLPEFLKVESIFKTPIFKVPENLRPLHHLEL
jgi:hypothetical protein